MGVLRWRSLLDAEIGRFSDKPVEKLDIEVLTALRLAAYQLLISRPVPARAAVHESVELVKRARKGSAAPFANAVLRKLAESAVAADWRPMKHQDAAEPRSCGRALARRLAHPLWLVERWVRQFGLDRARQICSYDQHAPAAAIRLADAGTEAELKRDGIDLAPGQLLASARRVRSWKCFRALAPSRRAESRSRTKPRSWSRCWWARDRASWTAVPRPGARRACSRNAIPRPALLPWSCMRTGRGCCGNWFRPGTWK